MKIKYGLIAVTACSVVWWLLSLGEVNSISVGWLFVLLASIAAVVLYKMFRDTHLRKAGYLLTGHISIIGVLSLLNYFVRSSVMGALDVAVAIIKPRATLNPTFIRYSCRLKPPLAKMLFAMLQNLLPGTLTVDTDEETLLIHVLKNDQQTVDQLMELESLIARAFGLVLHEPESAVVDYTFSPGLPKSGES